MELPAQIDPSKYTNVDDLFEDSYIIFEYDLNKHRPNLFSKFIFIDMNPTCDNKCNGFWHIASIGAKKYHSEEYPCRDDIANQYCLYLCDVEHDNNLLKDINSVPCIFRARKIPWIKHLISLANEKKIVQIWKKRDKKKGQNDLCVRYIDGYIDFVIIFAIVYNKSKSDINYYRLKTAFPVVEKSFKSRFDREYGEFIKTK